LSIKELPIFVSMLTVIVPVKLVPLQELPAKVASQIAPALSNSFMVPLASLLAQLALSNSTESVKLVILLVLNVSPHRIPAQNVSQLPHNITFLALLVLPLALIHFIQILQARLALNAVLHAADARTMMNASVVLLTLSSTIEIASVPVLQISPSMLAVTAKNVTQSAMDVLELPQPVSIALQANSSTMASVLLNALLHFISTLLLALADLVEVLA